MKSRAAFLIMVQPVHNITGFKDISMEGIKVQHEENVDRIKRITRMIK